MRRSIVIFSLVASLISFAVILLMYFGIIRNISIHTNSIDHFIAKYAKAKPLNDKVVVVIDAKSPEDIKSAKNTIKSLLDQTAKVNAIVLCTRKSVNVPEEYKKAVSVYRSENDGILDAMKREKSSDTKIISVKVAHIYEQDFVDAIVKTSNKHPDKKVTSNNGYMLKPGLSSKAESVKIEFD